MSFQPWKELLTLKEVCLTLKEPLPLPDYAVRLSTGVANYETVLRSLWEDFKNNPTQANARALANFMKENSDKIWLETTLDILGIDELSEAQETMLRENLEEHHSYIEGSLLPDLIKAISEGYGDFGMFDYRVIFLYAGALWSWGFLATVAFDGLELRDLADLFMFVGPKDEGTCTGPRGCSQHVGKIYTVLEILEKMIIPGKLACLTSCRHMLIPIASPL
jgi:hypothetical protein